MRSVYLVCYDVADDKRLRRTYKTMCGYGDPVQYSIFRCELSAVERQLLKEALWDILNWSYDRVMLIDLGPSGGRGDECIEFWGEPRIDLPSRGAVVV
ncbi:MAG: CRISPR-associated endonuclease Cas2 [Thermoguttaceae bacterium]|jgi:CRISPR-associated protein Cas2|nr:CRISPR-associated endonuclease Cas2 [Thermoguttaceae bacterium]